MIRNTGTTERQHGFTLIELMVSVSIFTVVMMVAIGALFTIIAANKHARAVQLTMDNLHFAIDEMSRDIRTGTDYNYSAVVGNECGNSFVFTFTSSDGDDIDYRCSGGHIQKRVDTGSYVNMTAPEITVTHFRVYDIATSQPRALILIGGEAKTSGGDTTDFNLQTTVSQRRLDIIN